LVGIILISTLNNINEWWKTVVYANNNTTTGAVVQWQCLPNKFICRTGDSLEDADNDANIIVKMCPNGI